MVVQLMSPFAYPYGGHRYVQLQTCAWSTVNSSDQLSEQFRLFSSSSRHTTLVFGCQVSPAWRHLRLSSFSGASWSWEESIIHCSAVALPVAFNHCFVAGLPHCFIVLNLLISPRTDRWLMISHHKAFCCTFIQSSLQLIVSPFCNIQDWCGGCIKMIKCGQSCVVSCRC